MKNAFLDNHIFTEYNLNMQNLFYLQICVLDGLNLDDRDRKVYLSGFGALGSKEKVGMGSMAMDSFTDINGPQPFER